MDVLPDLVNKQFAIENGRGRKFVDLPSYKMGGFSIVISGSLPEGIDFPISCPLYIPLYFHYIPLDIPLKPNKLNNMEK